MLLASAQCCLLFMHLAIIKHCQPAACTAMQGVKTVSTVPLANTAGSDYYFSSTKDVITTSPAIAPTAADSNGNADTSSSSAFFSRPPVGRIKGSPSGSVTADLVNCGLASSGCPGAAGKICLIQRGQTTFCQKLAACVAAGGVAAILYNAADKPACERFTGVDVSVCEQERPAGGWPLAVTVSRKQGEVLRVALANATAAGGSLSVSLNVPDSAPQKEIGLAAFSGTSMVSDELLTLLGVLVTICQGCSCVPQICCSFACKRVCFNALKKWQPAAMSARTQAGDAPTGIMCLVWLLAGHT
jgi:hypothetical protein